MQKVEIVVSGTEEEQCVDFIRDLARVAMGRFDVVPVRTYCGKEPVKAGFGELLVPDFMQCRTAAGKGRASSGGKGKGNVKIE